MLLAIADFADDDGRAYPSVTTLATKCRMKARNANYVLAALKASGELEIRIGEGPRGTNLYRVAFEAFGMQSFAPLQGAAPLQGSAPTPAKDCAKPLQHSAPEPSLNHQEPSILSERIPTCPVDQVIGLYNEVLPDLPRARLKTKDRAKEVKRVWRWLFTTRRDDGNKRASTAAEALAWFRTYFERTRDNDFLMGRTERSGAHANWRCGLDFLLTERGMKHVIEMTRTENTA